MSDGLSGDIENWSLIRPPRAADLIFDDGKDRRILIEVKQTLQDALADRLDEVEAASPRTRRGASFAARLAGRRRAHLRDEWSALLAGEDGCGLSGARRLRYVLGFLSAALKMRAHDLGGPLWRPVDWLLASTSRTNTLITLVVGSLLVYFARDGGFHGVLADGTEPCAIIGGGLYVLTRWLRRVRGIELAAAARSSGEE